MKSFVKSGVAAGALAFAFLSAQAHAQAADAAQPQANDAAATPTGDAAQPDPNQPAAASAQAGTSAQNPQEAADQPSAGSQNQEIVVTAQFRAQRLQDTPLSITAVPANVLEAREQRSVADLGNFAPNVNISASSSLYGNALSAFIRGVGQNDSNFALEPGVGVYIDDVYYGTTFGAVFDLTDLDRVEILRGPQGTLAGKNSVGGALKMFTKKPNGTDGGYIEGTYGQYSRYDIRGSANFAITDSLFARISAIAKGTDGFMKRLDYGCVNPGEGIPANPAAGGKSCQIGTEGGQDVKALRLALRYAPADSPLEINVVGDVARDKSETPGNKLLYANNPNVRSYVAGDPTGGVPFDERFITPPHSYTTYATYCNGGNYTTAFGFPYQKQQSFCVQPKSTSESWGVAGTIDYQLGDNLALKSITAYREADGYTGIDIDASPLDILIESNKYYHKQFTQELRLTGKVGSLLDYTVGGFYYDAHDRQQLRVEIPNVLFDFLTNDPVTNKSASAFAHVEAHVLPGLNLIGGIRYTHDKKTYTFGRRNTDQSLPTPGPFVDVTGATYPTSWGVVPLGPGVNLVFPENGLLAGLDGVVGTYKKGQVDWRLGINYRWSDALMTYAQVSTGYKGGGINPTPYVPDQVDPFNPEKVTAYEVGFKADITRAFRLNGAAFYNDYSDIQMTLYNCPGNSATPTPCSLRANAGDAHVKGAELEAVLRPVQGLTINGNVGYLDFNYTNVNPLTGVTKDMIAPFNAKWQASAGIQYVADLGGSGTLTPRLDWDYRSSFFNNAVNLPQNKVPGRSLFNARVTYDSPDRNWSLSGGVTNLFDKFYYNAINENIVAYGVATGVVGRPREWSVTVRRRF